MPPVSVIICFCEESWTPLLRTVHSVLNRTPPELLKEIILLDDASKREYLKEPLDLYMAKFNKVRIVRMKQREGLIRARLAAIKLAQAEVLVFLDSHIECSVGWLEPMLDRVWRDRRTVVQPVIDNIDMDSFGYYSSSTNTRGTFKWSMEFAWESTPMKLLSQRANATVPISTPTIAGGLFIIDKEFFQRLGLYDEGLDVWGVENLELSFKTWMCHGRLEISPCSHIGHIFRQSQPYSFPGGATKVILHNAHRVALTFLGPFIEIFYQHFPGLRNHSDGDVTDRRMILARNRCHNFEWYISHVHANKYVPDLKPTAGHTLVNLGIGQCLDSNRGQGLIVYPCHGEGGSQSFSLSRKNVLQHGEECAFVYDSHTDKRVYTSKCTGSGAKWEHEKGGHFKDMRSGLCLDVDGRKVKIANCSDSMTQKWRFDHYDLNQA